MFILPQIHTVEAATLYWIGADGANASVATNWSTTNPTSCSTGVTPSALAPATADTVNMDADCDNGVSWDSSATAQITILNLNAGYAGTVTLARSLIVSSTMTEAGGAFTAAANAFEVDSTLTLSAGTFTASSGTTTLKGALTISGSPTFTHNSGTVSFAGAGATLSCNNVTFNLVTFNNTANKIVNSNCSLPLGASPTIASFVTLNGTLSGTGTLTETAGTLTLNSGAVLSGFSGLSLSALTVAGATADLSGYSSFVAGNTTTLSSGSLKLPSGADLNGSLIISGGTFTAPSGTMTVAGALTISGSPTFNANSGTITFDGGSSVLACNNVTFNLVTFNNTSTKTVNSDCSLPLGASPTIPTYITLNGTLSGTGTLTESTNTLTLNAGAALSGFSGLNVALFTVAGATTDLSGYTSFVANGITTVSSGTLTLSSTANTLTSLTVNGGTVTESAGTFSASSNTILSSGSLTFVNGADLNGNLTISGGTFNAPSGTMTLAGSLTISNSPTFNANSGTITFDSSSSSSLSCNNVTFNLVTFNQGISTANKTVNSDCSLPLGNNPSSPGRITLTGGTLSGTGTFNIAGTFTLNTGATLSGFTGLVTNSVTLSGTTLNLENYTTVDINGGFNFTSGTLTAPSGTMTLAGTLTISGSSTFNANGGTLILDGGSASLSCNNVVFNRVELTMPLASNPVKNIGSDCTLPLGSNPTIQGGITLNGTLTGTGTINKSTTYGTSTFSAGAVLTGFTGYISNSAFIVAGANLNFSSYTTVDINDDLRINSGTFTAPTGIMTISGQFNYTGGTFNDSNGTVVLDGANQSITGSNTFYNLSKTVTTADTLTFPAGATQTVSNTLTLQGAPGNLLSLRSSTPTSQWSIDPQGTRNISYVDVQDSNNINTTVISATNSIDSGDNANWFFVVAPTPTPGPTATPAPEPPGPQPQTCSALPPGSHAPWLYAATAKGSGEMELQFQDGEDPITDYSIEYGTKTGEYIYGADHVVTKGTRSYIVKALMPSTTYYFRVRGGNGCAPGPWSNELSAKTVGYVSTNQLNISSSLTPVNSSITPTPTSTDSANEDQTSSITQDENGTYRVNVKVKDTNNKAVLGAEVTIHSKVQTAKTDKDGVVHFNNVESGDHTVYIAYNGYKGQQALNLTGDTKEFTLNIQIQQQNVFVSPPVMIAIGALVLIIIFLLFLLLKKRDR